MKASESFWRPRGSYAMMYVTKKLPVSQKESRHQFDRNAVLREADSSVHIAQIRMVPAGRVGGKVTR